MNVSTTSPAWNLARDFQLEAAARCLPKKVSLVRDAVATVTGHPDGAALAASPGYDPVPKPSGGWLTWSRFDVTASTTALQQTWSGKCLHHSVSGGGDPCRASVGPGLGKRVSRSRPAVLWRAAAAGSCRHGLLPLQRRPCWLGQNRPAAAEKPTG
jgi:hypothetical protein